jgi:hypothetical protein
MLTYKGRWFGVARRRASGNPQMAANARWGAAAAGFFGACVSLNPDSAIVQLRLNQTNRPTCNRPTRLLMETLHLTTWGTSRRPLEQLLLEAATCYRASQRQRTGVWSVDQVGAIFWWREEGGKGGKELVCFLFLPASTCII